MCPGKGEIRALPSLRNKAGEPDPETGDVRTLVRVAGLGAFYFEGERPTAERIVRHRDDVTDAGARRAGWVWNW